MAIPSEIEKLERRWNENPSGLLFAPLAEAYRKGGEHDRALDLLEHGLQVHPEYVPALIVRGRCHLERGSLEPAEADFRQALDLDPINPIALRGLAEVLERTGRAVAAVERLELLLEIDRGDADARASLARLRDALATAPEPAEPPASAAPPAPAEPSSDALPSAARVTDRFWPAALDESPAPGSQVELEVEGLEVENLSVDPMEAAPDEPATSASEARMPWEPLPLAEPAAAWGSWREPEAQASPEAPEPELEPEPAAGAPVPEVSVAEAEPAEEAPAAAPEELAIPPVASEPLTMESPTPPEEATQPVPPESPEAAAAVNWPPFELEAPADEPAEAEAVADAPAMAEGAAGRSIASDEPELIVTESMAEVFLRQGHTALALAVYRQLVERQPESVSIREAIERLEGDTVPAPPPVASRPSWRAADTGGTPVSAFLSDVLHAPAPAVPATVLPPAIEPGTDPGARGGAAALSLGAVFGDEPAPPPPAGSPEPASTEPSYDEFFGTSQEVGTAGAPRLAESEDLRQFNDWLRGLKR